MVNVTLWWLFAIPLILSTLSFFLLPKLSNGSVDKTNSAIFAVVGLFISMLIMAAAFYLGKGSKTHDEEIWNGRITQKQREHGSYVRSYSCNCVQTCSGSGQNRSCSQTCQTCYEDHYTVKWFAHSTIGTFDIDSEDSTSRRVYDLPDPPFYRQIQPGEACAKTHSYTNYIKAVPESLFRPASATIKAQFAGMVPAYPISIYNFWHVDRVLPVKINVPNLREWNIKLSDSLRELGPAKQANAVIVLVNTPDPNYIYALQDSWLNGKKNDIIVVIGATQFPNKADWVSVLALTDSEQFKIVLRDDLLALENLTPDAVIGTMAKDIGKMFKRKPMADFDYLDAEIDPPLWVNVTTATLVILAYIVFWMMVRSGNAPRFMRSYSSYGYGRRFR